VRRGPVLIGVVTSVALMMVGCGTGHPLAKASTTTTASSTTAPPLAIWTTEAIPAGVGDLNDVVCPSVTQCYAVGGMEYSTGPGWILGSSDGGKSWTLLNTTSQTWLAAIACPTTTTCIAVGGGGGDGVTTVPALLLTTDSGKHWSNEALPSQIGGILDIACGSQSVCVVVGNTSNTAEGQTGIARTTDEGATWTVETSPTGLSEIDSVTCSTTSFCIIGGAGPGPESSSPSMDSISNDGGASWTAGVVASGPSALGQISCVGPQACIGLVESGGTNTYGSGSPIMTSDGGRTWKAGSTGVGEAVSCVMDLCVSVGGRWTDITNTYPGDAFVSTDSGTDWEPMTISTPYSLTAVVCLSGVDCVAVGGNFPNPTPGAIFRYGS